MYKIISLAFFTLTLTLNAFALPVVTTFDGDNSLQRRITRFASDASYLGVHEFSGYSVAGYADMVSLRANLRARILELVADDVRQGNRRGGSAKSVFVCGGTVDGIGVIYEIIEELRLSLAVDPSRIMVMGIVNSAKETFHGRSYNAAVLDAVSLSDRLHFAGPESNGVTVRTSLDVYGGDPAAFDDAFEVIMHNYVQDSDIPTSVILHAGYDAENVAEDQGARPVEHLRQIAALLPHGRGLTPIEMRRDTSTPATLDPANADVQALARRVTGFAGKLANRVSAAIDIQLEIFERYQAGARGYTGGESPEVDAKEARAQYLRALLNKGLSCKPMLEPQK